MTTNPLVITGRGVGTMTTNPLVITGRGVGTMTPNPLVTTGRGVGTMTTNPLVITGRGVGTMTTNFPDFFLRFSLLLHGWLVLPSLQLRCRVQVLYSIFSCQLISIFYKQVLKDYSYIFIQGGVSHKFFSIFPPAYVHNSHVYLKKGFVDYGITVFHKIFYTKRSFLTV
jgi:hypothetical protein